MAEPFKDSRRLSDSILLIKMKADGPYVDVPLRPERLEEAVLLLHAPSAPSVRSELLISR